MLLVALLSSNCSRFFTYAGFELNRDYIAKELCINKDRSWMNCNGRCYFMNKLKQADEKEKKQEREDRKNQYQEGLPVITLWATAFKAPILRKTYPTLAAPTLLQRAGTIFQPPKIA
ncbi:hypothetical protein GCM10028827_11210 [Mucilaginibacter myungsuensis]